jgi:hypothetical protein
MVQLFIFDICLRSSSADLGSFQKAVFCVIFSFSVICSSLPSMSKIPPQRITAFRQTLYLLGGYHHFDFAQI